MIGPAPAHMSVSDLRDENLQIKQLLIHISIAAQKFILTIKPVLAIWMVNIGVSVVSQFAGLPLKLIRNSQFSIYSR
jgi:hypothetical protein